MRLLGRVLKNTETHPKASQAAWDRGPGNQRFIPDETVWIRSHYFDIPETIAYFCGDMRGASVLDVGSGEMLADFGLIPLGVKQVTGLDVAGKRSFSLAQVYERITRQDIPVTPEYPELLRYVEYDGLHFPFKDEEFDIVYSWSAFEHIADVPQVLREIRRVCRRDGRVFLQVCPWYHCRQGSHLTDLILEPYFHLKRPPEWVRQKLEEYVELHPEQGDNIFRNLLPEYLSLNKYSANRFHADVIAAGFTVQRTIACTYEQDLTEAPRDVPLADLMIFETKMLLRP